MPASRELPLNPYASEPLAVWEARLASGGDSEPRFRAFDAVTQLGAPELVCGHALRLCHDADPELRAAATRWLATAVRSGRCDAMLQPQRSQFVEQLRQRLNDSDLDVQLEAARGLVVLEPQSQRLAEVVCGLLAHEDTQSTTQAALAELCGHLPQLADRTINRTKQWLSAASAELREAAATALARWGAAAAVAESELVTALEDEEPLVREQAAVALGQLAALSATSRAALQLAMSDEDVGVANAAKSAFERHQ